jgi:hypothetical protein
MLVTRKHLFAQESEVLSEHQQAHRLIAERDEQLRTLHIELESLKSQV